MIENKYRAYLTKFDNFNYDTIYIAGSHAYGLATEESDIDIRGFIVRSGKDILLSKDFESIRLRPEDVCLYSFDKFVKMLAAANPNIIEFLGIHQNIKLGPIGRKIQQNKNDFLSLKIADTSLGFALSEQKRIDKMINNNDSFSIKKIAKAQSHLVRICNMCLDILLRGIVFTNRKGLDADFLLEIKQGCLVDEKGTKLFWNSLVESLIDQISFYKTKSKLPQEPNYEKIKQLIIDVNKEAVMKFSLDK